MLRFDVYGTIVGIERVADQCEVFYIGAEGKHRLVEDICDSSFR